MKNIAFILLLLVPGTAIAQYDLPYKFAGHLEEEMESDTTPWKYQMGATRFSISGNYKRALEIWDMNGVRQYKLSEKDSLYLTQYSPADACMYILDRSEQEHIIIINEAHHIAKHRHFTASLLQGLYDKGYRYLGLEALFEKELNERGYPVSESGFYIQEPEFGNLVAQAIRIGYVIFGYEASEGKNGKEREIEQAQNIKSFMDNNPDGKVIIHCGFNHVFENDYQPWEKAMAGRLKEYTGINPFTVNQEILTEKGAPERTHPIVNSLKTDYPVVLVSERGEVFNGFSHPGQTDVVVVHPPTTYPHNRPHWIQTDRNAFRIPDSLVKEVPALVKVYRKNESTEVGIPADVVEVQSMDDDPTLFLAPGTYTLIVRNSDYTIIDVAEITVL